jgi:excisionase family DNA binding protein
MTDFNSKRYLTSSQVAELLMVSPITVRQWAQYGKIPSTTTLGGHRRFFPADVEKFARQRGMRLAGKPCPGLRVLVTDDDIAFASYLEERLRLQPEISEVEVANDGFEAGLKVEAFKPDIVLLDMMMPDLDGLSVCKKLKSTPANAGIRVIAMTGFYTAARASSIIAAGAETCLAKPFSRHELLAALGFENTSTKSPVNGIRTG